MASSGTFTSGRYGNSSVGPYLTLSWTQVSQSIANNTTTLDLTLKFHWSGNISYVFYNRTGSLQGHSYTYSGSVSGTSGSRVLKTQRVTIKHNSNGAKSVTLSGNITNLGLTYSGNRVNTMSVSGTANLNTIPRASTLSAFSFNANLKNGVANQINYTIDRKSSSFRHQIQLRDGSTTLRTWDNISSDGASTLSLTATEVNTLLNRMSSSTTKSYTLRVATRSGSGGSWIGSAVSRNATATVHSDVRPSVSSVTLSQTGNPVSTHTLQGFSKIKASFTRSAGYGASISSSSIQVRRKSGGADSQTINSNSGTTSKPVSLSGVYEARGTARDSRGRTTHTAWATIDVTPYNAPTITNFSAVRDNSEPDPEPEKVNINRITTHTVLGTSNHLTYTIQRRQGTGAWTNVDSGATGEVTTSGATGSATSNGNEVTKSYEFRMVVTDKLGGRAESIQTVSTQRVVLDVHKNEGVGIGKIHERGVLDVDGTVYMNGKIMALGGLGFEDTRTINDQPQEIPGRAFSFAFKTASTIGSPPERAHNTYAHILNIAGWNSSEGSGGYPIQMSIGGEGISLRQGISTTEWGPWSSLVSVSSGSNSNGDWIRFGDGTQICSHEIVITEGFSIGRGSLADLYRTNIMQWNYPKSFYGTTPSVSGTPNIPTSDSGARRATTITMDGITTTSARPQVFFLSTGSFTGTIYLRLNAIGRWK